TVLAARSAAKAGTRATVGRLIPVPGGTNVVASRVDVWLDARSASEPGTREAVDEVIAAAQQAAADEDCEVEVREESFSGEVAFDAGLRDRFRGVLGDVPVLPTGAGHDAGVLAAHVPTGMLYVRNPTGVSHAPEELACDEDGRAGERALAAVV